MTGFGVVLGVGEFEFGTAFSAEEAVVDVFEEPFDCFFVGGAFFITVCERVNRLGMKLPRTLSLRVESS